MLDDNRITGSAVDRLEDRIVTLVHICLIGIIVKHLYHIFRIRHKSCHLVSGNTVSKVRLLDGVIAPFTVDSSFRIILGWLHSEFCHLEKSLCTVILIAVLYAVEILFICIP